MPKQVFQNSDFSNGLTDHAFSMQSILDVFAIQGLIGQEDADNLKKRYRTNRDIERVLLSNRIATRETINKAYSIMLKIPYVSLLKTKIDKNILEVIPKKIAQRYGIIAFGLAGNDLQVAICKPLELNTAFRKGMETIMADKPYSLSMFITGPDDFNEAIKQYSGKVFADKLNVSSYPVVYLRNQNIPKSLVQKLPETFIQKHRAVIFDQRDDKNFSMAAERPDDSEVRRALDYIQKQNGVSIQLFATSKEDVDYILAHYSEDDLNDEYNEIKEQAADIKDADQVALSDETSTEAEAVEAEEQKDEKISLGGIFSGLKAKSSDVPAITMDSYSKSETEQTSSAESEQNSISGDDSESASDVGDESGPSAEDVKAQDIEQEEKTEEQTSESIENMVKGSDQDQPTADPITITDNSQADSPVQLKPNNSLDDEMQIGSLLEKDIRSEDELRNILSERYIPKVVAAIINYALFLRSSDVHVEAGGKDVRIRYRVDGILRDIAKLPVEMHPPIISRIKILAKMKIDETRIPQDGRFDVVFKHKQVDVRVSALPTVHGEKIVMRVLDKDQGVLSLEDLGMTGRAFELTIENIAKPYGIILSTGPTGSGKSTTLYAILNRISTASVNIVTLEDPVEYEIPGVNQCQIKPAIGFTFAEGLRSVLRQDPNVVMVGEVRDGETAAMATHAALTGHLVLSTLHTNDAAGALPRLTNMGIEPFLITSSINEIIAQRLVRRICPKCKEEMKLPQSLVDSVKRELAQIPASNKRDSARVKDDFKFYHGVGCDECSHGYKGRVGIFEVLRMNDEVEALAIDRRSTNDIRGAAMRDGMISMRHDGLLKCIEGITTIDEVYRATSA